MKKICFFVVLFFACAFIQAQTIKDADFAILEKINQANIKHTSMTSDFDQVKHLPILGEDIKSKGKLYYGKPEKMALWYTDPEGDLMLINEDRCVMVASGKKREVSAKANAKMRGMKNILTASLQGGMLQMGANKVVCSEDAKNYIVTADIDSKVNKSNIKKVIVHYAKSDLTLSVLKTEEADGSYTEYTLKNKVMNQAIDEKHFTPNKK